LRRRYRLLPKRDLRRLRLRFGRLLRYTLAGDANLDGKVDFADLLVVAQRYNGAAAGWIDGDFNFDGKVNLSDLLALARRAPQPPVVLTRLRHRSRWPVAAGGFWPVRRRTWPPSLLLPNYWQ